LFFNFDRHLSELKSLQLLSWRDSMSIYVGNLSYDVTQDDLNAVFAEYGTVKRVQLPLDRETGRPRGFGFVEMSTEAEETAAIEALDGAEWMGRDLRVNKAKPRENRAGGGGGGGGRGREDRGSRFGGGGGGGNSWSNSGRGY
jgi:RNA recognition motif-containing protein